MYDVSKTGTLYIETTGATFTAEITKTEFLWSAAPPQAALCRTISPGAAVPFCVPSNQPDHTLIGTTRTKEHNNHWTPLKITTKSVIIPWPIHALLSVSGREGRNVKSHPNSFSYRSSGSDNLIKIYIDIRIPCCPEKHSTNSVSPRVLRLAGWSLQDFDKK